MKFAIPFLGAVSEAAGTIIEKKILMKRKVETRTYNTFSFMSIVILLIPIIFLANLFFPSQFPLTISQEALSTQNILIILAVIILSITANLFTFYALKWEKITEIEPMRLMQPMFTILLAFFIFSTERQTKTSIIILSIIAALTIIFSHIKKHHFSLNKYAWAAILGSLFFALELVVSKEILTLYPPLIFYFVRCFGIFILGLFLFKSNPRKLQKSTWPMIFGVSFIWIVYRVLLYSSYLSQGVIITTLLFILTPVFIYIFSWRYLREQFKWRNLIASIIIVICVAIAMWINSH
jgi:drug/metabolite transporter (DMT)-like permease